MWLSGRWGPDASTSCLPCCLQQINKIPLDNLRSEGKIDEEEYENFMRYAPRPSVHITVKATGDTESIGDESIVPRVSLRCGV